MTAITVKTQAELDTALKRAEIEYVDIDIRSEAGVWLYLGTTPPRATVRAWDSATVRASGSATVSAWDSATVRAWDSATVRASGSATVSASGSATVRASGSATVSAWDSATVRASGSATVSAWDSATVRAWDSATVSAWDSATVSAWDSATVRASGSATVRAWGSATVRASGSATVSAWDSATVRASGSATVSAWDSATVSAWDSATVRASGSATVSASSKVAVHLHSARATVQGGVLIDVTQLTTDPTGWCEENGVDVIDGIATLYKAVTADLRSGYGTTYPLGQTVAAPDWRDDNDCGGGLHLCPSPEQATSYHSQATRWLRCEVDVTSIRPIDGGAAKCKVREVRVVAEVDAFAREVVAS